MSSSHTRQYLERLVAFPSVTLTPNVALIEWVQGLFQARGIPCTLVHSDDGTRANLFASVGPSDVPGVLLSAHTDVVPVEGQAWTMPPFACTEQGGRLFGRGTCDMKGFVACAITAMLAAADRPLKRPLQLALSYDEEIGCVGVRRLLDLLEVAPVKPMVCIVGEPTSMQIATGHKGKAALRAACHGVEGHSSLAPQALNALHLACDFIGNVRQMQARLAREGARDAAYDVPYTTLHVGKLEGGKALNIVPHLATLDFEIRHLASDDPARLLEQLQDGAERLVSAQREHFPTARIEISQVNAYPGLDTQPTSAAVRLIETLLAPDTRKLKVAFGTEGGLFAARLDVPVMVCGPGSIEQAHKPDEYVELSQLERCDAFLAKLVHSLC